MSSIVKALRLLGLFSVTRPEIGLSDLCRLAQRDKATTYRHLQALENVGLIERNLASKAYRLGPALLHLARMREVAVPRREGALPALSALAKATGETAHASVLSGLTVYPLVSCESSHHSTRVVVDVETFPLHATAAGLCALTFGPSDLIDNGCKDLRRLTEHTFVTRNDLTSAIRSFATAGFAQSDRHYENDVHGFSAPLYDQTGLFAGAVAVACVAGRVTPDRLPDLYHHLMIASREITRNWGGEIPKQVEAAWAAYQPLPADMKAVP